MSGKHVRMSFIPIFTMRVILKTILVIFFSRHVIFAPSSKNIYASEKFAGIGDAMYDIDKNPDPNKWETVKQQLAAVTHAIKSAASTLEMP